MKLHYYPETDSLYIELKADVGAEVREVADGLNVDLNADGDVVGFDLHPVVPEAVPHGRQPSSFEFIGPPELVERPVDDDDACHDLQPSRCDVSL